MRSNLLLLATILLIASAPVLAHHAFAAEYDAKAPMSVTGVITKIEWTNPHTYVYLDVTDDSGKVSNWAFEGYPPNTLKRTGFTRDLIKVGDKIGMTAFKAKDGANRGAGREITLTDGKKIFLGPAAAY